MTCLDFDASGFASTAADDEESEDSDSESVEETTARSRSFGCDTAAVACVHAPALRCVGEGTPRTKSLTPEGMEKPTGPNDA